MSFTTLSIISGLFWVNVAAKQALVCPIDYLDDCLEHLPAQVREQLPREPHQLLQDMSQRPAMVIPLNDPSVLGLVLTAPEYVTQVQVLHLKQEVFEFTLHEQEVLSLWHEMGHLAAQDLADTVFQRTLSPFEHEWIADCYVIWLVAHQKPNLHLAWQQYHRRNIDVMSNRMSMSHWTVPILWTVLKEFDQASLKSFIHFDDFLKAYLAIASLPSDNDLFELSGLLQHTFEMRTTPPLPHYLYWRKEELTLYLRPTLEQIMGQERAAAWVRASSLHSLKNEG
ncbi:hypothetical protein [uncultured Shewanella sp.]|uniref:hypothetical protein n=1 Tax=uncultured Shewanella sp. TaxID=173975 RepID=UPI002639EED7|nr:hypothetical protein [uncultured Shewanella sp.]